MLSVVVLKVVKLSDVILNAVMLCVVILNVESVSSILGTIWYHMEYQDSQP
jgi:hypothetical protein